MHLRSFLPLLLLLVLVAGSARAGAGAHDRPASPDAATDSSSALRLHYTVPAPQFTYKRTLTGVPGLAISIPSAYGAAWGQLFGGLSYQHRVRYAPLPDAGLAVGGGLGDPARTVGLEVVLSIWDTYTDFFEDRSLSVKIHRRLPGRLAVGAGIENVWKNGGDGGTNPYVVVTRAFSLSALPYARFSTLFATVGVGGGRFQPEQHFYDGRKGINVFGSMGLHVTRQVGAIAEWTGQDLNVGFSVVPLRSLPFVVTAAVADVTGNAGDKKRFILGAGVGYLLR